MRCFGFDPGVGHLSETPERLTAELDGRSLAIVGNSRALAQGEYGKRIDRHDIVIRINRAPMPSEMSHGRRTSWLALATTIDQELVQKIDPDRVLWMSHKRKRLPFWVAARPGFYLHPQIAFQTLRDELGAPPTTGLMMIDLAAKSGAKSINLYGFDFFSSLSLTGGRTAAQVPHDFAAEKAWVGDLATRDSRLKIHR